MLQRQFVLQPNSDYLLHVTAKQYWLPEFEAHWDDIDAQTLILLHSTSFHKEIWEPTIQCMFEGLVSCPSVFKNGDAGNNPLKIKCAWAIECPNHGQSAVLNDTALQQLPYFRNCKLLSCMRFVFFHLVTPSFGMWHSWMRKIRRSCAPLHDFWVYFVSTSQFLDSEACWDWAFTRWRSHVCHNFFVPLACRLIKLSL